MRLRLLSVALLIFVAACSPEVIVEDTTTTLPVGIPPAASVPINHSDKPVTEGDSICFVPLEKPDDLARAEAVAEQSDPTQVTAEVGDICVLERSPDSDETTQHYYGPGDGFARYLMYASIMRGSKDAVLAYGLIEGDLTPSEYLVLHFLMGVDRYGSVYHPYVLNVNNGSWTRHKTPRDDMVVRQVRYGTQTAAVPLKTAQANTAPNGYTKREVQAPINPAVKKADSSQRADRQQAAAPRSSTSSTGNSSTAGTKSGTSGTQSGSTSKPGKR